jgi:hypothetical protein
MFVNKKNCLTFFYDKISQINGNVSTYLQYHLSEN